MEKIPYSKELKAVSDDAVVFYILDAKVLSSTWLFLQHIAVENETTNYDNLRIGQGTDPSRVHWWEDRPTPAAGVLYEFEPLFFVPEGSRFIAALYGTTVEDVLGVYLDGYTSEKRVTGRKFKHRKGGE